LLAKGTILYFVVVLSALLATIGAGYVDGH
jgi:hypothetical protein